jgi:hypothetical protein
LLLHYSSYHTPLVKDAGGGDERSGEKSGDTASGRKPSVEGFVIYFIAYFFSHKTYATQLNPL